MILETWYYEVVSIDGDYANLRRTDADSPELKLVARALLPAEIKEGTKLKMQVGPFQVRILDVCQHRIEKAIVHLMEPEKNPAAET